MSIPKIIHFCWFGRQEHPDLVKMCVNSWKQILPNYEIKIWDENSFDVYSNEFTKKSYLEKKWAFVSDYVRVMALYKYGGVYMDTDLEVIRDFSKLLEEKKYVTSCVEGGLITAGFIASEPGHPFVKKLLNYYEGQCKLIKNGEKIIYIMNPLLFTFIATIDYDFSLTKSQLYNDDISIYPPEYFMPYKNNIFGDNNYDHKKYHLTNNTYAIHHDMSSWAKRSKFKKVIFGIARLVLSENLYNKMKIIKFKKMLNNYCSYILKSINVD